MFESPVDPADPEIQHLRFSPSQLDVWDRCPRKGYYIYRQGYKNQSSSPAMRKGTVIHKILEVYYSYNLELIEIAGMIEDMFPLYDDQIVAYEVMGLMTRYSGYYASKDALFHVLAVERNLCVPFTTPAGRTVYLNGIVDLIGETENGKLFVMDHKSTSRVFWNKDSVYFDRQLHIYMAMLYLMGYDPRIGVINNINTGLKNLNVPAEKLFTRVVVDVDEQKVTRYLQDIGQRIDQVLSYTDYPRVLNKTCSECTFKEACSLTLQGVDETEYLESNFREQVRPIQIDIDLGKD